MGNPKRISVDAIQAMKKILDALPDKNLGRTQEEALTQLNAQIQKAYAKGYSVKELAAIMVKGNVPVSAPTLRTHTCPSSPRVKKAKAEAPPKATVEPATQKPTPAPKAHVKTEPKKEPSFFTPDIPDTEL